jgi:adenylate kinase
LGSVIGITGTPGTGKKSIAPLVASALGLPCLPLPRTPEGAKPSKTNAEVDVDTERLREGFSRQPLRHIVAYGHLLPYILPPKSVDRVIVLRCDPKVLKDRLARRGYSTKKIIDNVEAELIGLISEDSRLAFGARRTLEFDTTPHSPASSAKRVLRLVQNRGPPPARIDWTLRYGSARKLKSLLSPAKASLG